MERPRLKWRKGRRSVDGDCVEIARCGDAILIRDSRGSHDAVLALSSAQWSVLTRALRRSSD
ncbi:DUF397 domain-containing protein [Spirillospora sp. CA-253888]